jgi:hypothetical protein
MRTNNAVDRVNGRLDQRHMPISVDDNLFIPTRPNDLTKIDNLAAGTNASHIEDIEYIHKRLTASTKIPRSYLGFQDGLSSKSTLSMEDIRFASTINSIQKIIIAELNQLAILHLYAKGFTGEDLVNFEIKLSNPSTIAIQQKLNLWNLKFETASKAKESGLVDEEFIQREILDLNSDTIINIRVGKEKDQMRNKTLEALQPPNPNKFQDDQSIIDPFDPSNYVNVPKSPITNSELEIDNLTTAFGKLQGGPKRDNSGESKGYEKPQYAPISVNNFVDMDRVKSRFKENIELEEKVLLEKIIGTSLARKIKKFNEAFNINDTSRYIDVGLLKEEQENIKIELKEENVSTIED